MRRVVSLAASAAALLLLVAPLHAQNLLYDAHLAFGDGRYDDALRHYRTLQAYGVEWDWLPELIETVEHRKALGTITPQYTQKILIQFYTEVRFLDAEGRIVRTIPDVTDELKRDQNFADCSLFSDLFFQMHLRQRLAGNWFVQKPEYLKR